MLSNSSDHLNLVPPQFEDGKVNEFIASNRTLFSSFSPLNNSLSVFVAPRSTSQKIETSSLPSQPIYFAGTNSVPFAERRLFITDTSIIFAAFQNLLSPAHEKQPEWFQEEEIHQAMRKLAFDYVNFIKECWVHTSQLASRTKELQFSGDHYRSLYTCFSLFVALYLPEASLEDAPVGDDLMEWLNTHYIEPSTEEGDHLSGLESPWEDESFWPYITRATLRGLTKASVFFLDVLSRHPSEELPPIAQRLIPLLESQPRLQNFEAEREFVYASRRWKDKVKALRLDMDRVPESDRYDGFDNWWDRLSDIVGILEGRSEVIQKISEELGGDWKEVCAAWGVFVDARLRRQDLPDIMGQILEDFPPDPTSPEDRIHAALLCGQPAKALLHALQLDSWLAAHLADVMEPLGLIEKEPDEFSGLSIRDQHILTYADYLHSDPAFWRITADYMCSCGDIGQERADEILLRVPLRLRAQRTPGVSQDDKTKSAIRAGDVVGVLQEINKTCFEHKREAARRAICRIAAQNFVQEKVYGLAVSYSTSAEDWPGLGRIVDKVLEEYINNGAERFARYVADIAPSLQNLRTQHGPQGIFVHRLMFTVRYAEFHRRRMDHDMKEAALDLVEIFLNDLAPKSWWAVLLNDSVELLQHSSVALFSTPGASELLRRLQEIFSRTDQGSGDDYLDVFIRALKLGGQKEALQQLKQVRLALAKYLARSTMLDREGQ